MIDLLPFQENLFELRAETEVGVGVTIHVPTVVLDFFFILRRIDLPLHSVPLVVFLLLQHPELLFSVVQALLLNNKEINQVLGPFPFLELPDDGRLLGLRLARDVGVLVLDVGLRLLRGLVYSSHQWLR